MNVMIKSMPKRLMLFVLALVGFGLVFVSPVHAQNPATDVVCATQTVVSSGICDAIVTLFAGQKDGPWYSQSPSQFAKKVTTAPEDEIFGERYTYAQINWIINSVVTMVNPISNITSPTDLFNFIINLTKLLANKPGEQVDTSKLGFAGVMYSGFAYLYQNPPASAGEQTKALANKIFDVGTGAQPAYAQGFGFTGITTGGAVKQVWTASRNISYLIMVILLVAAGFLIMFRVKINPQTVVSIQVMIPKIIVTMLLVTFSLAIAGLVLDLVYVFILLFAGMFSLSGIGSAQNIVKAMAGLDFTQYALAQFLPGFLFVMIIPGIILGGVGFFTSGAGWAVLGVVAACVAIYFIVLIWKIFWMLLKAYVMIILQIVVAPLQIMLDLIPGQQGFGPWLRNLIANASVFVVVPVMFILQNALSISLTGGALGFNNLVSLTNPIATLPLPYLNGSVTGALISFGIGFVILSLTPKVADIIRDVLKVPPFKYESAIYEALNSPMNFYNLWDNATRDKNDKHTLIQRKWEKNRTPTGPDRNYSSEEIEKMLHNTGS